MRFATTTARDNAFGGAGEPTLAEGMFAYIDADNSLYYYSGSTWSKYVINLTVDTKTNDYTFVAGDVDKRVVANKASAIAFTVNNSIFSAGDTLAVHNINTGLLTLTAGAGVTINGADVLTVAQYQGGTLFFTSASSAIFFPTSKGSSWVSFTPTLTNITLGNGSLTARYIQIEKFVMVKFRFTMGSTSSMSTNPAASLPVTADTTATGSASWGGLAYIDDAGTNNFHGTVTLGTSTRMDFYVLSVGAPYVNLGGITSTTPMTWTTSDILTATFWYEAA